MWALDLDFGGSRSPKTTNERIWAPFIHDSLACIWTDLARMVAWLDSSPVARMQLILRLVVLG